jgi:HSP20 family molecular chaperone IbpA
MEKRLSTIFGRPLTSGNGESKEAISVTQWSPLVDITEDDKEYLVKAEIPEIKKEDIKINVHDDVLTLSGERKYEKEERVRNIIASSAPMGVSCAALRCLRMRTARRSARSTKTAC